MIITIGKFEKDCIGSFILQKNPNAKPDVDGYTFTKTSKQYGVMKGKYIEKDGYLYFQIHNKKTALDFLAWARKQNMGNYNFIHRDAICPASLKAFDAAFRDIVQGNTQKKISKDDIAKFVKIPEGISVDDFIKNELTRNHDMVANIAPLHIRDSYDIERVVDAFKAYGITAELIKHNNIEFAYEVKLTASMPIEEFFQKVFLITFYLTIKLDIPDFSHERIERQVERFANVISSSWLKNYNDNYTFLINLNKQSFLDDINPDFKEEVTKLNGLTFKTIEDFEIKMIDVFGSDYYIENKREFIRAFRYTKVINRIIKSLARYSPKFQEKFKLLLTDDVNEQKEIKQEFDMSRFGSLHRMKHSRVIDEVSKINKANKKIRVLPQHVDKKKSPFKYMSNDVLDVLLSAEFQSEKEFKYFIYNLIPKSFKYKINNINHRLDNIVVTYGTEIQKDLHIIDYGSGSDLKLTKALKNKYKKVFGFDASLRALDRYGNTGFFTHMNILYPQLDDKIMNPDVLLSIEVIEHLEKNDRIRMLKIIRDVICPEKIILTTPNISYNKFYETMTTQFRHKDHKIEYTANEFNDEVVTFLKESYDIESIKLEKDKTIQQSFFLIGTKKKDSFNKGLKSQLDQYYEGIYLPYSGYTMGKKEMRNGYASKVFQTNKKNIFFAGTTIAPVDFSMKAPTYLEHPLEAIEYYKERGVTDLVAEKKYMGSRAYILAFKDIKIANKLGFDSVIIINSRNNYPFFENVKLTIDSPVLKNISNDIKSTLRITDEGFVEWEDLDMLIYNDMKPSLTKDFAMFDAEIMPWLIKGGRLIDQEFRTPAEMTLLKNKLTGQPTKNAKDFLNVLDIFSEEKPLEVRLFGLIADADIRTFTKKSKRKGKDDYESFKIENIKNGFNIERSKQHYTLGLFNRSIVKSVEGFRLNVNDKTDVKKLVDDWTNYCEVKKGEGFVIKTNQPIIVQDNGHLITPMLKVRGREYLRIIYGHDMYDQDFFEKLKRRSIKGKRILSVHQAELSNAMINAFLRGHVDTKNRYLAGFIGMENLNFDNIDKTL